jgi:hypothetical protein
MHLIDVEIADGAQAIARIIEASASASQSGFLGACRPACRWPNMR